MNLFKLFLFYTFVILTTSAVAVAQVPLFPYPPDDGSKSYYVTGENGVNILVEEKEDPEKTPYPTFSRKPLSRIYLFQYPEFQYPEIT